jgi:hypothetical protein
MDYLLIIAIFSIGMLALVFSVNTVNDRDENTSNKSSHKFHTLEFTDEEIVKLKILAEEQPRLTHLSPVEKFKKNRHKMKKDLTYNKPNITLLND